MRAPIVHIVGPSGNDLAAGWGTRLTRVSMTDYDGGESDELSFDLRVTPPFQAGPPKGTVYRHSLGWDENALRPLGRFTVQRNAVSGSTEDGYLRTTYCRAADFIDAMKEADSEHYDDMTAGGIFSAIAARAGVPAVVDPSIASVKLPYRLRWKQSAVDFANDLADELGGTLKLAGGKLLVAKRNAATTAGGGSIPAIVIPFDRTYEFDVEIESRPAYKQIASTWFDPAAGIQKRVDGTSIGAASRFSSLHPFATKQEAEHAGRAIGAQEARQTVSGTFTTAGNPYASAGAPVTPQGFGAEIDGLDIVASTVRHDVTFEDDSGGWLTTIEVESREAGK